MVRRSVGILVAAFLVSGVMPTNARADPQITERFEYYDVDGMTADEIRSDLNRRGPTDSVERRHFDAVTHWHVRWRYTYTQGGRGCKIKALSTTRRRSQRSAGMGQSRRDHMCLDTGQSLRPAPRSEKIRRHAHWRYTYAQGGRWCEIEAVSTVVQVTYSFPRLADPTSAPADLRLAFSQYLERLLVHEKGHAQNGIDIAARIEDRIRHLPPAPTCTALGEIANESGHALIKEAIQRDVDYDAETQHGKTQGARFPRDNLPMGGGRGGD
jgi:predicted secreted Zn-dependent protease